MQHCLNLVAPEAGAIDFSGGLVRDYPEVTVHIVEPTALVFRRTSLP